MLLKVLDRWDLEKLCPQLGRPCCLALCKSSRLLIAFEQHFAFFNPESHDLERVEVVTPGGGEWEQVTLARRGFNVRLNDGRVENNGALIIGGINESWEDFKEGWKAVQPCYSVEMMPDKSVPTVAVSIIQSIHLAKISNSICFSNNGSRMYYTDTPTKEIRVYHCDGAHIGEGEIIIKTENQPDGSVIDAR